MSKLQIQFNAGQVPPSEGGSGGLPVGKHPVQIIAQEIKATANNDGGYLAFTLQALQGSPAEGATQVDRLNVYNKSETAVKIALERLSAYCHVVNRPDWDSNNNEIEELFNIPFIVEIAPQKDNPKYTEVAKILDINGNKPSEMNKGAGQQQQSNPAWNNGGGQQQPAQQNAPAWNNGGQQNNQVQQNQQGQADNQVPSNAPAWGQQNAPQQQQQQQQGGGQPWTAPGGQPASSNNNAPQQQQAPWNAPQQ